MPLQQKKKTKIMVDFYNDLPKGQPKLDPKYWDNLKNNNDAQNSPISDFNATRALEEISIFNGGKK